MANIEYKPVWSEDGQTLSNVLVKDKLETYNVVTEWYDGTPLDDSKLDSDLVYVKYEGKYLVRNFEYGQVLQKDTMQEMRDLSSYEILLLKMGVYKHVQLNGYYEKGDTPSPINYVLSSTEEGDDGGSVIEAGDVKLEHEFDNLVESCYFGVSSTIADNSDNIDNILNYFRTRSLRGSLELSCKGDIKSSGNHNVPSNISVNMKSKLVYTGGEDKEYFFLIGDGGVSRANNHVIYVEMGYNRSIFEHEGICGAVIRNNYGNNIYIKLASKFSVGVKLLGQSSGCVFNNVIINQVSDNYIGIKISAENGGWVNDNLIQNGSIIRFSSYSGYTSYGVVADSDNHEINNNVFEKVGFEGSGTDNKTLIPVLARNRFSKNKFYNCRWETSTVTPWYNNFFALENINNCEYNSYEVEIFKDQPLLIGSISGGYVYKSSIKKVGGNDEWSSRVIYSSGNLTKSFIRMSEKSFRTNGDFFIRTSSSGADSNHLQTESPVTESNENKISLQAGRTLTTKVKIRGIRRCNINVETDDEESLVVYVTPYDVNGDKISSNSAISGNGTWTSEYTGSFKVESSNNITLAFRQDVGYIAIGVRGVGIKSFILNSSENIASVVGEGIGQASNNIRVSKTVEGNYTCSDKDEVVMVDSSSETSIITLPNGIYGQQITVVDFGGNSEENPITVQRASGSFLGGGNTRVIQDNYTTKTFYYFHNYWVEL